MSTTSETQYGLQYRPLGAFSDQWTSEEDQLVFRDELGAVLWQKIMADAQAHLEFRVCSRTVTTTRTDWEPVL